MIDAWGVERTDIAKSGSLATAPGRLTRAAVGGDNGTKVADVPPAGAKQKIEAPWKRAQSGQGGTGGPMVIGVEKRHNDTIRPPLHRQQRRERGLRQAPIARQEAAMRQGVGKGIDPAVLAPVDDAAGLLARMRPKQQKQVPPQGAAPVAKSLTELVTKAVGDQLKSTRGGVGANYRPSPKPKKPFDAAAVRGSLAPLKDAMLAAAKK